MTRAVGAVRIVASERVNKAAGELMDVVNEAISFANEILVKDTRFGRVGWKVLGRPMPGARHPALQGFTSKIGEATDRFIIAAQKEMKVPRPRQKLASGAAGNTGANNMSA